MRMTLMAVAVAVAAVAAGPGAAEPFDSKAAKKLLFSARGFVTEVVEDGGLDDLSLTVVRALVQEPDFRKRLNYYGALAFSPAFIARVKAGTADASTSGLAAYVDGYHSPRAAEAAAMAVCNKARRAGEAACAVAIRVLPKRWKQQPLSLSVAATAAFAKYRKAKSPKAFAMSPATRAFALHTGEGAAGAALADCNITASRVGSPDCQLVIAD